MTQTLHPKQPWFTPVLVVALALLLVGWHIGDWVSHATKTYTGNGFSFRYGGHWQVEGQAGPGGKGPSDARFAGLGGADSSTVRLVRLDAPYVRISARDAGQSTSNVGLDQMAYNTRHYAGYASEGLTELPGEPTQYQLAYHFQEVVSTGERVNFKGEDRLFVADGRLIVVSYTAPADAFAQGYAEYSAVLASLSFN
ncbi:MAG: hypothetical protein SFY70_01180 [Bacteroidia bacterium]|nr:hypothetical protein [Bacteroidia bacterium]